MSTMFHSVNLTPSTVTPPQPTDGQPTTGSTPPPSITVVVSREAMAQLDKVEESALALSGLYIELSVPKSKLNALENELKVLTDKYPDLAGLIENAGSIEDLLKNEAALRQLTGQEPASALTNLQTQLTAIASEKASLQTSLAAINVKIDALERDLAALGAKIASPDGKTEQQRLVLNQTARTLIDKQAELKSLQAHPLANATRITALQADITQLTETYKTQYGALFGVAPKPDAVPGAVTQTPAELARDAQKSAREAQMTSDARYLQSSPGSYLRTLQIDKSVIDESIRILSKPPLTDDKTQQIKALSGERAGIVIMMTALQNEMVITGLEKGNYYQLRDRRHELNQQILVEKDRAKLAELLATYAKINNAISGVDKRVAGSGDTPKRPDGVPPTGPGGAPQPPPAPELSWPAWLGPRPVGPAFTENELAAIDTYTALQAEFAAAAAARQAVYDQIPILEKNLETAETTLANLPVNGRIPLKDRYYDIQLGNEIPVMKDMTQLQRDLALLHTSRAATSENMLAATTIDIRNERLAYRTKIDVLIAKKEQEILIKEKALTKERDTWADWRIILKKDILETTADELEGDTSGSEWYFHWREPGGGETQEHSVNRDWEQARKNGLYTSRDAMWNAYRLDAQTQLPKLNLANQWNHDHLAVLEAKNNALTARIAWLESKGTKEAMTAAEELVTQLETKRDANSYDVVIQTNPQYTSAERKTQIENANAAWYETDLLLKAAQADLNAEYSNNPKDLRLIAKLSSAIAAMQLRLPTLLLALENAKADGFRNPAPTATSR